MPLIPQRVAALLPSQSLEKIAQAELADDEIGKLLYHNQEERLRASDTAQRRRRDALTDEDRERVLAGERTEIDRLRQREDDLKQRREDLVEVFRNAGAWLEEGAARNQRYRHRAATPHKLKAGETFAMAIAAERDAIAKLEGEIARLEAVKATSAELKRAVERQVDAIVRAPHLRTDHQGRPTDIESRVGNSVTDAGHIVGDAGASLFFWLLRDQIVARLHGLIDEAELSGAMTAEERATALEGVSAAKLEHERQEEALIMAALEAGFAPIPRRPDADPRAVLEIEEVR